ncbi:MAG: transaldolase family protein [Patescibacteria group bacterium]|nr:transaldolase family protein [Patescibacteria group bacterium]
MTGRPKTRIFVDGGDPDESKQVRDALGFLDGQTTNPTLVSKNPHIRERIGSGGKFSLDELLDEYRKIVQDVSKLTPDGSISIEVYADQDTTTEAMLAQGREMFGWIPNAQVKFPTTTAGLAAAEQAVADGIRVNLTLCFSQEQAAAVYAATRGAKKGQVYVSPFVGRLDDRGEDGMSVVRNIIKMYRGGDGAPAGDGHVELLTASIRHRAHLDYALALGSDIITAPAKILLEWAADGAAIPDAGYKYDAKSDAGSLKPIPYRELDLSADWRSFDLHHDLTDAGIEKFSADWNALLK